MQRTVYTLTATSTRNNARKRRRSQIRYLLLTLALGSLSMGRAQLVEGQFPVVQSGPPDLAIKALEASPNVLYAGLVPYAGWYQTSTLSITVENRLTARPSRFESSYYGSQANNVVVEIKLGKGLQMAGTNYFAGLGFKCSPSVQGVTCSNGLIPPGAFVTIVFDVIAPNPVACSMNTLVEATADPQNIIPETSETNNTKAVPITLQTIC